MLDLPFFLAAWLAGILFHFFVYALTHQKMTLQFFVATVASQLGLSLLATFANRGAGAWVAVGIVQTGNGMTWGTVLLLNRKRRQKRADKWLPDLNPIIEK